MTIPIFSSDGSLGRSILTASSPEELKKTSSVSIFSIAKHYNLDKIYLCDTTFFNFVSAYRAAEKLEKQLIFGIKFEIVDNAECQTEEEFKNSSSVRVWMKNSDGYKDLIKLYSISNDKKHFYFNNRIDWKILQRYFTENLFVTFDFYNNFLFQNFFHGSSIYPDLSNLNYAFEASDCGLPLDFLMREKIDEYVSNKNLIIETHPIYYYDKRSFLSYLLFRLACDRRSTYKKLNLEAPEFDHMGSDEFCFESFCEKTNLSFVALT